MTDTETARLHDEILTGKAEIAKLRDLLTKENKRANQAIDREETAEQAAEEAHAELKHAHAALARIRQMADHWEQHLPEVIRTPAVVSALRAALDRVSSAVVAPPTGQTALRDRIAEALISWTYRGKEPDPNVGILETVRANAYSRADAVLAVLCREWPWLRAEAEDAAPTDHTTPPAWVDGHPQLEAIAAAVWEQCGRSDNGACVDDDPRNIAVAALSAVRNTADDQAAENKRLRAKVFEWQGSYLDEVKVRQERDAEIARLRADRAAVLRWAADRYDRSDRIVKQMFGHQVAAELRRLADQAQPEPGARHVHITIHHPDPTTATTAALCIADLIRGEYSDSHRLTITTDAGARQDGAQP